MKNVLKIVFVIIGTIIGAGFSSGQEIHVFFGKYGKYGIWGLIISIFLIGAVVYKTLEISQKKGINTYRKFLNKLIGEKKKYLINIIHTIITVFLGVTYIIMAVRIWSFFFTRIWHI